MRNDLLSEAWVSKTMLVFIAAASVEQSHTGGTLWKCWPDITLPDNCNCSCSSLLALTALMIFHTGTCHGVSGFIVGFDEVTAQLLCTVSHWAHGAFPRKSGQWIGPPLLHSSCALSMHAYLTPSPWASPVWATHTRSLTKETTMWIFRWLFYAHLKPACKINFYIYEMHVIDRIYIYKVDNILSGSKCFS